MLNTKRSFSCVEPVDMISMATMNSRMLDSGESSAVATRQYRPDATVLVVVKRVPVLLNQQIAGDAKRLEALCKLVPIDGAICILCAE